MQMLISDIPVNYQVPPPDRLRVCRQARKIYKLLKDASDIDCLVSNKVMSAIALKYTNRVSEIRAALKKFGWTVKCVKKEKSGLCYYTIMELETFAQTAEKAREQTREREE